MIPQEPRTQVELRIRGVKHTGWVTEKDLARLRAILNRGPDEGFTSIILYDGLDGGANSHLQFRSKLLDSVKI